MTDLKLNDEHRVAGTVKFGPSVSVRTLVFVMMGLKTSRPGRWIDLHVRKGGDDGTHYIAFHYILEDGLEKTHKAAVCALFEYLRREFGEHEHPKKPGVMMPNGVREWSISTVEVLG
jgi:hypothetical protein